MNIFSEDGVAFKAYKTTYKPKINSYNKTCWSNTEVVFEGNETDVVGIRFHFL